MAGRAGVRLTKDETDVAAPKQARTDYLSVKAQLHERLLDEIGEREIDRRIGHARRPGNINYHATGSADLPRCAAWLAWEKSARILADFYSRLREHRT